MNKYAQLVNKIRTIKLSQELEGNPYPNYNAGILSPEELTLIVDALETIQFLEIVFKVSKENHEI